MSEREEINGKINTELLIFTLLLEMVKWKKVGRDGANFYFDTSLGFTISTYYFYNF